MGSPAFTEDMRNGDGIFARAKNQVMTNCTAVCPNRKTGPNMYQRIDSLIDAMTQQIVTGTVPITKAIK